MAGVPAGRLSIEIVAEIARLQQDLDKAKRAVNAASRDIAQSTAVANDNLAGMGRAMGGVTRSSGTMRAGMQQLSFQVGDVATMFALGARPMQIFASQAGQIIQSVQLMAGGTSRLAAFLGGPWGVALTAAMVVLTPMVAKLFEGSQAADQMREAEKNLANSMSTLADSRAELDRALGRNVQSYNNLREAAVRTAMAEVESAKAAVAARLAALAREQGYANVAGNLRGRRDAGSQQAAAALGMFGFGDTRQEVAAVINETATLNGAMAKLNQTMASLINATNGDGPRTSTNTGNSPRGSSTQEDGLRSDAAAQRAAMEKAQAGDQIIADLARDAKLALLQESANLQNKVKEEAAALAEIHAQIVRDFEDGIRERWGAMDGWLAKLNLDAEQLQQAFEQIQMNGIDAMTDGLVDVMTGFRSLGDVARSVLSQILSDMLRLQIQQNIMGPLSQALGMMGSAGAGPSAGLLGSVAQAFAANPGLFAKGTLSAPAGLAIVGEEGPELVNLRGGERIYTAGQTQQMMGGATTINVNVSGAMNPQQARETGDQIGRRIRHQMNGRAA